MASTTMTFDDSRARRELGISLATGPVALYDSARWFVDHDYVTKERVAQLEWHAPEES